ncbi:MAG: hypothetical protein NVSMB32_01140 [Actinomycetota bacterium]
MIRGDNEQPHHRGAAAPVVEHPQDGPELGFPAVAAAGGDQRGKADSPVSEEPDGQDQEKSPGVSHQQGGAGKQDPLQVEERNLHEHEVGGSQGLALLQVVEGQCPAVEEIEAESSAEHDEHVDEQREVQLGGVLVELLPEDPQRE